MSHSHSANPSEHATHDSREPQRSVSVKTNGTFAFDESSGIFRALPRRFLRTYRATKRAPSDAAPPPTSSSGNFTTTVSAIRRTSNGSGGVVMYANSSGGSHSTNGSGSESSSQSSEREQPSRDFKSGSSLGKSKRTTSATMLPDAAGHGDSIEHATRPGAVRVSSSPSLSGSCDSSDTEYAPPSDYSEHQPGDDTPQKPVLPLRASSLLPGSTAAEEHDDDAVAHTAPPPPAKAPEVVPNPSSAAPGKAPGRTAHRHAAAAPPSASASSSYSSSPSNHSEASAAETSSTSTETASTDEEDVDVDADSMGMGYSKLSGQSEGPSSRVPFSNSGLRRHAVISPTDDDAAVNTYAPRRDIRSTLVSTADVDVAVVRRQRRQRQGQLYLQAALHNRTRSLGNPLTCSGAAGRMFLPPPSEEKIRFLERRTEAIYDRHMEAFVEQYLSAAKYRTALVQFRKYLSVPEQQLRTAAAQDQYLRATKIMAGQSGGDVSGNHGLSGNDVGGLGNVSGTLAAAGAFSAEASAGKSEADHYRWEKADLELLVGDTARRARLLDDTLPWRPINFDDTNIRLEPLEHLQAELGGGADIMTGGSGGATPAVGGSVNLLIEVLILTEMDVPFNSTIPVVNYTNVFLLLATEFVQAEVLLTKLIRFYRSVRAWEAEVGDTTRAACLERRILQCIIVYCRVHETDLTLSCLQRLATLVASEGFLGPVNFLDDAIGKERWPCQDGVYSASRRRAEAYAATVRENVGGVGAVGSPTSPSHHHHHHHAAHVSFRQSKRSGYVDPPRLRHSGSAGSFHRHGSHADVSVLQNPATRVPLQSAVAQTMLEFIVYLQRTIGLYYRPVAVSPACRQDLHFELGGPSRMYVDTTVLRPGLGCTSLSLRAAMGADPQLTAAESFNLASSVGLHFTAAGSGSGARMSSGAGGFSADGSSGSPSRYDGRGEALWLGEAVGAGAGGASGRLHGSPNVDGRDDAAWRARRNAAGPPPSTMETTVTQKPVAVTDIDAEHLSQQICLLSFSLFTAVHIRELLNKAWTDSSLKVSVSTKLTELTEFSAHVQRWAAAMIITPSTWLGCQRALRYFLEVCRMLYEQQNYEMAAAILEGLKHPAVDFLERTFAEVRGQGLLTSAERRELETLQELMDPFASYSPSSLYSVAARTVGEMETPMIPLLSPILGVIFRSEDAKGATVSIRGSDGQAVVNWSKLIGLGKMVVLWMRCQYTPFAFPVDPEMQEFLWSIMYHQWTDALLLRAARRVKQ